MVYKKVEGMNVLCGFGTIMQMLAPLHHKKQQCP
jgi:hypothetical protein